MSKAVRSIGRGIKNLVSGVVKGVKKFAKSKIGRIIIMAAAVYFGGAALMGAMGSSGAAATAGLSGLQGAAANVAGAWSSLGTAGSALAAGELGAAGSAISSGFAGGAVAGPSAALAGAVPAAATVAAPAAAGTVATAASPWVTLPSGQLALASEAASLGAAVPAAGKGLLGSIMASPYAAPALISGGTQLVGGALQGYGQRKALEDQREYEQQMTAEQRARYNQNVGASLWGPAPTESQAPALTVPRFEVPPPRGYQPGPLALLDPARSRGLVGGQIPEYDPTLGRYV